MSSRLTIHHTVTTCVLQSVLLSGNSMGVLGDIITAIGGCEAAMIVFGWIRIS